MSPSPRRHPWVVALLAKLLDGDDATLSLVRDNPFPGEPPRHVRVVRYRYRFTTPGERADTGRVCHRERVGTYLGPMSRSDPRARRVLDRPEPTTTPADD
jgi:hypothetical protein